MKNIRDLFFGLMNQSQAQFRICKSETNVENLWAKCQELTDKCSLLDRKINNTKKELDTQHATFYLQYQEKTNEYDKDILVHTKKINKNGDVLDQHAKVLEDLKMVKETTIRKFDQ